MRLLLLTGLLLLAFTIAVAANINSVSAVYDRNTNTVQFTFNSFGVYEFKRVYINVDQNEVTGFCGGFDFLIENGELYGYDGTDASCDWRWLELCPTFAIGDLEDRTIWSINAENIGNLLVGAEVVFELEELGGKLTRQNTIVEAGEVSALSGQECRGSANVSEIAIVAATARIDLSSQLIEIGFESTGNYVTKAVMIDIDNNPDTGHVNFLSENLRGFDVIVSNGFVSVYAGDNGSADFNWQQVGVAEQGVGVEAQADDVTWTFNTCGIESYLAALDSSGGALFYIEDADGVTDQFEASLEEYVSDRENTECATAIDPSSRLLADVTAANIYRVLERDNAASVAFLHDEALTELQTGGSIAADEGASDMGKSGGGGSLSVFFMGSMFWLWLLRQTRRFKPHQPLVTVVRPCVFATLCISAVNTIAQETTQLAETNYIIQFTEPRAGKFWVDVRGAESTASQQLMQALLSSALIRVNETMWNGLEKGMPIRVENCGASDALYNQTTQEIVLCWELYNDLIDAFTKLEVSQGSPEDFARAFLVFVMYHELAHAIADFRQLPNAGNMESNADGIATVLAVEQGYAPFVFVTGLLFRATGGSSFGGIHPGEADRAGDLICWVTGGDSRATELAAYRNYIDIFLNEGRDCITEYQANRQLIADLFPDFIR